MIYHVGTLAFDMQKNPEVREAARLAWERYTKGEVVLVQRQIDRKPIDVDGAPAWYGVYEYLALPASINAKPRRFTHVKPEQARFAR